MVAVSNEHSVLNRQTIVEIIVHIRITVFRWKHRGTNNGAIISDSYSH
jgi:hypothetical protein